MSSDPYKTLGVTTKASDKEIKSAYRKLAKDLHPDLNPGDSAAEDRFKAISAAYNLLGDKEKRARFDAGEIDASGMEAPQQQYYHSHADSGPEHQYYDSSGFGDFSDESDLFAELFARAQAQSARDKASQPPRRGFDAQYHLKIDFLEAALGAKRRVTLPDGSTLDIKVPAGIESGKKIRLKGKGMPGFNGGPKGDAYVTIEVAPHKTFQRKGRDILLELPITLDEAILGGKVSVPTIHGPIKMNIPSGARNGQTLRLKGKGIAAGKNSRPGNQLVSLKVVMPEKIDKELHDFIKSWQEKNSYSVRQDKEGAS